MLTEKFRVLTLPVGLCGDFTVQMFDDTTKVMWLPLQGEYMIANNAGQDESPWQTIRVGSMYRANTKRNGVTIINLQEIHESVNYAPIMAPVIAPTIAPMPLIYVGALLLHDDTEIKILAVKGNQAWVEYNDGDTSIVFDITEIEPRMSEEDKLVKEALGWVEEYDTDHDQREMELVKRAVRDLISNGYRKHNSPL